MKLQDLFESADQTKFFDGYKKIAAKFGWKQRADHLHHPLHGTIEVNRHGEWLHLPHGSLREPDEGFGGSNEANFERHLKQLQMNESLEPLTEGWHNHKDGTFTADMSDIEHHHTAPRCPVCREKLPQSAFKKHTDREGDTTHWTLNHNCGAKLTIFNEEKDSLKIPALKPRNPNQDVLASKKNAGGPMKNHLAALKRGDTKHQKRDLSRQLEEAKGSAMYQVRIESERGTAGDWKDIKMHAASLEDMVKSINAHPMDSESANLFGLHELTNIVEDWIGAGPNSRGSNRGSWDEMDFEVKSFKDDVLKVEWHFSGVDMSRLEQGPKGRQYGTPVSRHGVITIMPAAAEEVKEAVASPFETFEKGDRVKVKKTGEEVTVVSQNDIGLVFTKTDDAKAHFFKGGSAQSKGYKEYMPRELELVK